MAFLFVYGTLCFPEITENLTGKSFVSEGAVLKGYIRKNVNGKDYPAIIKHVHSQVKGLLLQDVDVHSLKIITFYEGNDYRCEELIVDTKGKSIIAKVFLWSSDVNALDNSDWIPEVFALKSLNTYLKKIIPETLMEFNSD